MLLSEAPHSPAARLGLLEREDELAALREALEDAVAGRGSVVLVEGPAGVGKSSLIAAAEAVAADLGAARLTASGSELESALAFGVASQLLPTVDLSATPSGTDRERHTALLARFHAGLVDAVLPAAPHPSGPAAHLVVVDDAQWADSASLACLAHLALRARSLPVALILGVRTGDAPVPAAIETLRGAQRTRTLHPGPLSHDAVRRLIVRTGAESASDAFVAACAEATGGIPFYLCELLHELPDDLDDPVGAVSLAAPASVLRALLARLAALGDTHAQLASSVAILGDGVALEWAAELAGLEPLAAEAAADQLAAADLLATGELLSLAHPLIGSTLRSDMGSFARSRAHRAAATVLRDAGAPIDQIANHLARARPEGDPETVATLCDAAALARGRGEPRAAIALLGRALSEPPDPRRHATVLTELARAEVAVGDPHAREHLERALEILDAARPRAEALGDLARMQLLSGDFESAIDLATRGRDELERADPLAQRLESVRLAASLLSPAHDLSTASDLAALDDRLAGRRPDPTLSALLASHLTFSDGDAERAIELATAAFADDPLVDEDSQGMSLAFAGSALVDLDRPELAAPMLDAAVGAARDLGLVLTGAIAAHLHACLDLRRGELASALAHAEDSLTAFRNGWTETPWAAATLAWVHVERGDLDAAAEATAITGDRTQPEMASVLMLEARARVALARDDPEAALTDATDALDRLRRGYGRVPARGQQVQGLAVIAADRLDDADRATALAEELTARARAVDSAHALGTALAVGARLHDGDRRRAMLRDADTALRRSGSVLARLHVRVALGAADREAGDHAAARETLFDVLDRAERCGARPLADRARRELWELGVRPRRAARTGVEALTPGELRVATSAARGLTTPQIAHELYVTRKTVESHLSHVYRKLDISGRRELGAALRDAAREP